MNENATYSTGERVEMIGERNGFRFVTFHSGIHSGITTKVPASWVTTDEEAGR